MSNQWFTASAPCKFVILGEHSVVYGKPAMILAADRRMTVSVRRSTITTVNGLEIDISKQPHLDYLMRDSKYPLNVRTMSEIPTGSGLGSSAALSAAAAMAIRMERQEPFDQETLVKEAYEAELNAQGSGSPMDASTCVHGGGIAINVPSTKKLLWSISRGDRKWDVSSMELPEMTFVIGNTGIRAPTGPQVYKVRKYKEKSGFASEIIDEIGNITLEGYDAMGKNDVEKLGRIMTRDHKLLSILGVSCKELNKLVNATLPYSYGAKLTGSGGGGCMIALTDRPDKVAKAIECRGGTPYIVKAGAEGVRKESSFVNEFPSY